MNFSEDIMRGGEEAPRVVERGGEKKDTHSRLIRQKVVRLKLIRNICIINLV